MFKFLKGKNLVIVGLVLLLAVLVGGQSIYAIGTKLMEDYTGIIKFNQGYYSNLPIQTTSTVTGAGIINSGNGAVSGTFSVGGSSTLVAVSTSGLVTANAGVTHSYLNSTSTADTTQEITLADIANYSTVHMTPTVGATTLTFQASSTFSTMIPSAGDWFEQVWYNASSTASQTLTFAAGTGWDIETSTSSPSSLVIDPNGSARLLYMRGPDPIEDISLLITRFEDAD